MEWIELSVSLHPEAVDAVADVFQQHGTGGVAIHQDVRGDDEGTESPTFTSTPLLKGYLPNTAQGSRQASAIESSLWHLQAFDLSPIGPLRQRVVNEEEWQDGWKEHFHPLTVGRVVIKPTWRTVDAEAHQIVLELDPGMAFGTGLHPTTSLTLLALQQYVQRGAKVLDLGTGSGILALAAAKLGGRVLALDTSEVAVQVARSNVEANRVLNLVDVKPGSIERAEGRQFDLVCANIIASVLVELAPQLAAALAPSGKLLASGIIESRLPEVEEAFARAGLQVLDRQSEGDWYLLIAARS